MKKILFLTAFLCTSPMFSMGTLEKPKIRPEKENNAIQEMIEVAIVNGKIEWLFTLGSMIPNFQSRLLSQLNKQGATPLFLACQHGQTEIVRGLLLDSKGIRIREILLIKTSDGDMVPCTPLHMAAAKGHTDIVEQLIDCGATINSQHAPKKRTPLHYAVANGHVQVVKLLCDAGAYRSIEDIDNNTPISLAAAREYDPTLTEALNTKIHLLNTARHGWTSDLSGLITIKANLEVVDNDKATPLILAAYNDQINAVKLLLNAGANIHARDSDGFTALDWAQSNGLHQIRDILKEALKKSPAFDDKGKEEL